VGGCDASNVIRILGRPATGRVKLPADSAGSRLKEKPNSCDKVARGDKIIMKIIVGLRTRSVLNAVMVHTGPAVRTPWRKLE